jgi:hypothetical protein
MQLFLDANLFVKSYIILWYIAVWNFVRIFYQHNTEIFYPLSNYNYSHVINDVGDNDNDGDVERELC